MNIADHFNNSIGNNALLAMIRSKDDIIRKLEAEKKDITKQLRQIHRQLEPRIIEGGMTVMGGGKNAKKHV